MPERLFKLLSFALVLSIALAAWSPARLAAIAGGADLVVIVDGSGSMWGQVRGEPKIAIARRVLGEVLGNVPNGANVGLVTYGHRRAADCKDVETVVPIGPIDHALMTKKLDALKPRGKTPIAAALGQVFDELAKRERPAIVILVSDGIESCKGDPCQTVRDAKDKGLKFVLDVIGFGLGDADVSQLKCAAQAGSGLYFPAGDAGQFAAALGQVVESAAEAPAEPAAGNVGEMAAPSSPTPNPPERPVP
jgi:Ca-activated chloride channel family protein